jgi:hypothetical protein
VTPIYDQLRGETGLDPAYDAAERRFRDEVRRWRLTSWQFTPQILDPRKFIVVSGA